MTATFATLKLNPVSPQVKNLLARVGVALLAAILLLLTQRAQAAEVETVWHSTPRPLRVGAAPGKLPRSLTWFNLENAEIAPGHAEDVLNATLGSFPKDADAVLFHVMAWNGTAAEPAKQHWALLDAHLRALPMSALRTLRHISLVYVTYRRPPQVPVVYTLHEDREERVAAREVADPTENETATGLAWGAHSFTVEPNARRVSFVWGPPKTARGESKGAFRNAGYQSLPATLHMTFDFSQLRNDRSGVVIGRPLSLIPGWMLSAAKAAKLSGDYAASNTQGLLLAGTGIAYQPVYTLWATAGIGPQNRRLYGGLVTQTTMVLLHDSVASMNWGTSYGAGAGIHLEWPNKN